MRRFPPRLRLAGILATLLLAAPAIAETVRVDSRDALVEALANSGAGTEIVIAPGEYGFLPVHVRGGEGDPLVLRSEQPDAPARFSGLGVNRAAHVVLSDLIFDYEAKADDGRKFNPFRVLNSDDIVMQRLRFEGDRSEQGFGVGYALTLRGVSRVVLAHSQIETFERGLIVTRSQDIVIRANDLSDMSSDGMNFAQVSNVLIENNYIHDFARPEASKAHPDMIQFWTNRTARPTRNVVIRSNLLSAGGGMWTQSIFMRNEEVDTGRAGDEMFYRNIQITKNLIINAHTHGITVGETKGLVVANNTLVRNSAAAGKKKSYTLSTPSIRITPRAQDVQILRNVAGGYKGPEDQADWTVAQNIQVQDRARMETGHYSRVFVGHDPQDPASFVPRAGGPLDGTGIGAPVFRMRP